MAERASLLQTVQIGVESVSGTAVAAGKTLSGTSIEPGIQTNIRAFKPAGQKFTTVSAIGKEWVEAPLTGQLSYTDWVYLAASGIQYTAPDQQEATAAYLWANVPSQTAVDTIKTYTIEVGGAVRAHKFAYGLVNNLGYMITREEATIKGSMIGQLLTDGITMTTTPTAIDLKPVLPTQCSIYMDTLYSDIGETKLLRCLSIDFETGERFGPVWPIDAAQTSFAAHVETEPAAKFKLKLAADAVGMGLLATMRTGAKKFFRVQAVGETIETTYEYTWQHDICGTVTAVSEFSDEDGIYAIEWTFDATYDDDLTYAFKFETTNALTAL
jgi:hypothetical protein